MQNRKKNKKNQAGDILRPMTRFEFFTLILIVYTCMHHSPKRRIDRGMRLPVKYNEDFDVLSEGPSSGSIVAFVLLRQPRLTEIVQDHSPQQFNYSN